MKPTTIAPSWANIILSITWITDCINPENSVFPEPPVKALTTWFNVWVKESYITFTADTSLLIVGNHYVDPIFITVCVGS